MTLRNVHLHGRLGKQFGKNHRFAVRTAAEALRALNCAFPGEFVKALETGSFQLIRGDRRTGTRLDLDLVLQFGLGSGDLHIVPVAKGAANTKGAAKTIIGTALIGGAIFMSGGSLAAPIGALSGVPIIGGMSWGTVAAIGLGLALSGISTLLAKPSESVEENQSYNLTGPTNSGNQGDPIQLIYGRTGVATVNISFDADIEDIGAYQGVDSSILVRAAGQYFA